MRVTATLSAPCSAERLFAFVDDLAMYPAWCDLVHRVEVTEPDEVRADGTGGEPAWVIELRARVGPLARSKRIRMRRDVHDRTAHVAVFERSEVDGKRHSTWLLRAEVTESHGVSTLEMDLRYDGLLWTGGALERVLADQITAGRERLIALVSATH